MNKNLKNISIIGIGRLGLCMALCLEKAGFNILGYDINTNYLHKLKNKTLVSNEPRVSEMLYETKNLNITENLSEVVEFSDILFISVPTPLSGNDRFYDHTILNNVLYELNEMKIKNKHVVIVCTVFPGYINKIGKFLLSNCENTTLNYNPEFIAQGDIINGILNPDIILIGQNTNESGEILEYIYKQIHYVTNDDDIDFKVCRMSPESAEITKLAVNCYVTTKIAYSNYIGDLCNKTPGSNKHDVLSAIGKDSRIGNKCLNYGYSFGGPCFPRDNRALALYSEKVGIEPLLQRTTDKLNKNHLEIQFQELLNENREVYEFNDVSYKKNCKVPIIDESAKLLIAKKLANTGKKVLIKDIKCIIDEIKKEYGNIFEYVITN